MIEHPFSYGYDRFHYWANELFFPMAVRMTNDLYSALSNLQYFGFHSRGKTTEDLLRF